MRGTLPGTVSIAALAFVLALSSAAAQDKPAQPQTQPLPTPSKPVAPDGSILSFIQSHPDCTELTDECIICAVVSGKAMCSTPGIACVRKELRCVTTKPPTPKQ